jgi:hypothetical protein
MSTSNIICFGSLTLSPNGQYIAVSKQNGSNTYIMYSNDGGKTFIDNSSNAFNANAANFYLAASLSLSISSAGYTLSQVTSTGSNSSPTFSQKTYSKLNVPLTIFNGDVSMNSTLRIGGGQVVFSGIASPATQTTLTAASTTLTYPLSENYFVDYNGIAIVTLPTAQAGAKFSIRKKNKSVSKNLTLSGGIFSSTNMTTTASAFIDVSGSVNSAILVADASGWYSMLPEM